MITLWWTWWDYENEYDSWTCFVELRKLECIEHLMVCYNIWECDDIIWRTQNMSGKEVTKASAILEENKKEKLSWR